jgi:sulfopyruvate decarboxylase TPP-binding subunit
MTDELAQRIVRGLKDAGVNFVTYLPETRLSQIVPLIRDDPDIELISAASEQEAVTIAAGATLGGKQAAVYMENTGIYVSSYSLLAVGKQLGVPILLVVGFLGGIADQRNSFLYATIGTLCERPLRCCLPGSFRYDPLPMLGTARREHNRPIAGDVPERSAH